MAPLIASVPATLPVIDAFLWTSLQWQQCDGQGRILSEHLNLISLLGFCLSNDQAFSRMTVLGIDVYCKNVGGSIELSIVGFSANFLAWVSLVCC